MSQYYAYIDGTSQSAAQTRSVGAATLGLAFWAYVIARVRNGGGDRAASHWVASWPAC